MLQDADALFQLADALVGFRLLLDVSGPATQAETAGHRQEHGACQQRLHSQASAVEHRTFLVQGNWAEWPIQKDSDVPVVNLRGQIQHSDIVTA